MTESATHSIATMSQASIVTSITAMVNDNSKMYVNVPAILVAAMDFVPMFIKVLQQIHN